MTVAPREKGPDDGPSEFCGEAPENCDGELLSCALARTVSWLELPPLIVLRIQKMLVSISRASAEAFHLAQEPAI